MRYSLSSYDVSLVLGGVPRPQRRSHALKSGLYFSNGSSPMHFDTIYNNEVLNLNHIKGIHELPHIAAWQLEPEVFYCNEAYPKPVLMDAHSQ